MALDPDFILKKLQERKENGNLRQLPVVVSGHDFCSNDYLGLSSQPDLIDRIDHLWKDISDRKMGSTGSRLLSGNSIFAQQLEEYLAALFKSESTLLFSSGYTANQGLISTIADRQSIIIYDEYCHACIREGIILSRASALHYRHQDLDHLRELLKRQKKGCYVVTESLFSMDGDISDLSTIVAICEEFEAFLIVDEAHSTGVFGKNGAGLIVELGLETKIFARVMTFGKAMGTHGACVVGSYDLKNFLINFSRPFIYTTAPSLHHLLTIKESFEYLAAHAYLPVYLQKNIALFKQILAENEINTISQTAIQPIIVPGNEQCKKVSEWLIQEGYFLKPILAPTVSQGKERLRISLSARHTEHQIKGLGDLLKRFLQ